MDEENGGGEQKNLQEMGQQVANDVQQTAKGAKDAANLAKNAATSNWLGVAKDALKLLKNKAFMKKVLIAGLASILLPILIWYAIITGAGTVISEVWQSIVSFFSMSSDGDGAIEIDSNQIDLIINSIKDTGVAVEGLDLLGDVGVQNSLDPQQQAKYQEAYQDALRKYIKKFFEAQAVTETLDRKKDKEPNKTYGVVKIYKALDEKLISPENTTQQLEYIGYEKMQEMAADEHGSSKISNYFSIDNNGWLVVPSFESEARSTNGLLDEGDENVSWTITLEHIDYVSYISKYTTPMNFFLYLNMISQNPEFVSAVADLAKDSEIRITVMYTTEDSENTETYEYVPIKATTNLEGTVDTIIQNKVTETSTITTHREIPNVQLTYVKTWFYEESILYERQDPSTDPSTDRTVRTLPSEKKPSPEEVADNGGETYYRTAQYVYTSGSTTTTGYTRIAGGKSGSRLGEKGSQGILDKNGNDKVDADEKVDENTRFLGLLDNKFRKPNSNIYQAPGSNLVSGAETLFGLLQQDSKTQYLEQMMRYALQLYTGRDYGVEEYDFSTFKIEEFVNFGSGNTSGSYGDGSYSGGSYIGTVDIDGVPGIVYNFLLSKGVPPVGAAAIMGNIQEESSFNPADVSGSVIGLIQWKGLRQNCLKDRAKKKNVDWTDVNLQLEFMWSELNSEVPEEKEDGQDYSDVKDVIMSSTKESDLEYATWYFARHYEVAFTYSINFEESRGRTADRYKDAQEWYQKFKENSTSGFISTEGGTVYYQKDYRDVKYGSGTISSCGCGPTAFAMVATDYTGRRITPEDAVAWCGNKYYKWGSGTSRDFYAAAAEHFNLPCTVVRLGKDIDTALEQLRKGNLVICSQGKGIFTNENHLIVLYMDSNGGIRVRDPNYTNAVKKGYNNRVFTKEEIHKNVNEYIAFER